MGPIGGPLMALLDGKIRSAPNEPPAPPAATPGPLPLIGLGASFAWSSRLRKRINLGSKA
jgi:MYXO-CTERM domain-containing protein